MRHFCLLHQKIPAVQQWLDTTGVTFRLAHCKQSEKPFHKNFRKNNTVREANGHNRVSALNLYPILPTETWDKTMIVKSGFQMVIKMIYLLIVRNSALNTRPVIEGYLQIYECSSELLKHVLNLTKCPVFGSLSLKNKSRGWLSPTCQNFQQSCKQTKRKEKTCAKWL